MPSRVLATTPCPPQGPFPPTAVLPHGPPQYYGPLGLPLSEAAGFTSCCGPRTCSLRKRLPTPRSGHGRLRPCLGLLLGAPALTKAGLPPAGEEQRDAGGFSRPHRHDAPSGRFYVPPPDNAHRVRRPPGRRPPARGSANSEQLVIDAVRRFGRDTWRARRPAASTSRTSPSTSSSSSACREGRAPGACPWEPGRSYRESRSLPRRTSHPRPGSGAPRKLPRPAKSARARRSGVRCCESSTMRAANSSPCPKIVT